VPLSQPLDPLGPFLSPPGRLGRSEHGFPRVLLDRLRLLEDLHQTGLKLVGGLHPSDVKGVALKFLGSLGILGDPGAPWSPGAPQSFGAIQGRPATFGRDRSGHLGLLGEPSLGLRMGIVLGTRILGTEAGYVSKNA